VGDAAATLASGVFEDLRAVVSDAAAQTVAHLAVPEGGGHVVEAGAGRGTKTIVLLSHAHRAEVELDVTCIDIDQRKLELLAERVVLAGYAAPETHSIDIAQPLEASIAGIQADAVLVDAPCSGLGTLRRHPEKRWQLDPDSIGAMSSLGSTMLGNAARLVRPGGFVVYSTCTVLKPENDDVVDEFLASEAGAGFRDSLAESSLPEELRTWLSAQGRLQTLPTIGGPDGHFAAVLRRDGEV
jgi:16S rRNA (cytosine967-C5)-methyltransferase